MARVKDLADAVRTVGLWTFLKNLWRRIIDDDLSTQAAAVSYAWLFAVFPFLLFVLTLFAYIPEHSKVNAKEKIHTAINGVMAADAAQTLNSNLDQVLDRSHGGLLSIGLVVTLWVASGGMAMTMSSLDTAYDAKRRRPFWVQRPLAILLTVIVTAMVLVVFLLLPVGTAAEHWLAENRYVPATVVMVLDLLRYVLAIALLLAFLAMLYHYGTVVRRPFTMLSPGAIFTVLVWFAQGSLFRLYVDRFGRYSSTYGAVGGVAILLLFFYLDALVLLVGAEINSQVDECCATDGQRTLFDAPA